MFEITHTPVPVEKRVSVGNLPDWFYEQIYDYAENTDSEQRQMTISQFCEILGNLCTLDGDRLTISPQIWETCFHKIRNICGMKHQSDASSGSGQTEQQL